MLQIDGSRQRDVDKVVVAELSQNRNVSICFECFRGECIKICPLQSLQSKNIKGLIRCRQRSCTQVNIHSNKRMGPSDRLTQPPFAMWHHIGSPRNISYPVMLEIRCPTYTRTRKSFDARHQRCVCRPVWGLGPSTSRVERFDDTECQTSCASISPKRWAAVMICFGNGNWSHRSWIHLRFSSDTKTWFKTIFSMRWEQVSISWSWHPSDYFRIVFPPCFSIFVEHIGWDSSSDPTIFCFATQY